MRAVDIALLAKGRGDEGFDLAIVVNVRVYFPGGLPGVLSSEVDSTDSAVEEGGLARNGREGGKQIKTKLRREHFTKELGTDNSRRGRESIVITYRAPKPALVNASFSPSPVMVAHA